MKPALAAILLLLGCRAVRYGEWKRRDACARQLKIYRDDPPYEYRVIKIVRAKNEDDLAWQACAEGAEALIALGRSDDYEGRSGAFGGQGFAVGRSKVRRSDDLEGAAIRWVYADEPQSQ